jgi:hypothetical protein
MSQASLLRDIADVELYTRLPGLESNPTLPGVTSSTDFIHAQSGRRKGTK